MVAWKSSLFDNALFSLQSLDGSKILSKTIFDFEHFSIQMHGLPVRYMNRFYGEMIRNTIGRVLELDVDLDDTGWGSYLHVRVDIDLSKPLA